MRTATDSRYEKAWSFLDQLQFFKIKLGLDSMNAFLGPLGDPHLRFPSIHIGGTNGKGSVGANLLSILSSAGYRVGFYTSPHLSSVRERFRIGNRFISREEFCRQAEKIIRILDGRQITYFEFTTALALGWFADNGVDLALLEVGMGGRLDATNVVTPLLSIITNVSMDHEQYLGNTIEEVAAEKAGIIKTGIPVITGTTDRKALQVIRDKAEELGSPLYIMGDDFSGSRIQGNSSDWTFSGIPALPPMTGPSGELLPMHMKGGYQVNNSSLALAALQLLKEPFPVSPEHVRQGLKQVRWPGRLEEFWRDGAGSIHYHTPPPGSKSCHFLLDGAHNPDGAMALRQSLATEFDCTRLILVWAAMADKDVLATLMLIAPMAEKIIFTRPDEERSALPEKLAELLPRELQNKVQCEEDVSAALQLAMKACTPDSLVCIAGSLYLVGRARQFLCGELVEEV